MGGKNVYYFLTPMERGRLQVLPVAYDVHKKAWFDTAASGVRHFPDRRDEALDWTDRTFTFNTTCFNCHVSQLATNYDLATDTYHTTWAEPGISCESCHGPAGEHVARDGGAPTGPAAPKDIKIIRTKDFTAEQMNDMCATCHAKMIPLSHDFRPGDQFFDHFDLVTLEHPDFYPDGRDLGENYTYTSWLMSPCAESGKLDCIHCHTPSGRCASPTRRAEPGLPAVPRRRVDNPVAHSHHEPGSKGNQCIACHMPMTAFRRDETHATTRCGRRRRPRRSPSSRPTPATSATPTRTPPGPTRGCASGTRATTRQRSRAAGGTDRRRPQAAMDPIAGDVGRREEQGRGRGLRGSRSSASPLQAAQSKWDVLLEAIKDQSPLVRSARGLRAWRTPPTC